jgi:argininosuccinate synthase
MRALRALVEQEPEVVTLTLDLGQRRDLDSVRGLALGAGAVRAHVVDARETLMNDFFLPALRACSAAAGGVVLARDLCTAAVARSLVEIAHVEGTRLVAHTAAVDDVERHVLLEALIEDLAPRRMTVVRASSFVETDPHAAHNGDASFEGEPSQTSLAREVRLTEDANHAPPAWESYKLTRAPFDAPDTAAHVTVELDRGFPTAVNGVPMPLPEILDSLDTIVGAHGVGRYDGLIHSYVAPHQRSVRHVGEAPGAFALAVAQDALERWVWPAELCDLKEQTAAAYRATIRRGQWFSPTRDAIDAFVQRALVRVTGTVRLDLFKGRCQVANVRPASVPTREAHSL